MTRLRRLTTILLLIGCVVVGATGGVLIASHTRGRSAAEPATRLTAGTGVNGHTSLSAGGSSVCAITPGGRVDCWGVNPDGLLGVGVSAATGCEGYCTPRPARVLGIRSAVSVAVGNEFACALLRSGLVDCWGANNYGQLGVGDTTGPQICQVVGGSQPCARRPVTVPGIRNAVSIGAGGGDACAVVKGGRIYCWGVATDGVLGDASEQGTQPCGAATTAVRCNPHPGPVFGISDARAVSVGLLNACAMVSMGRVACWGDNGDGQLGDRATSGPQSCTGQGSPEPCSLVPVLVDRISGVDAVTVGAVDACALLIAGVVDCWGDNSVAELGTGSTKADNRCGSPPTACAAIPQRVALHARAEEVSAGSEDACAVLIGGRIDCWGDASVGALGTGKTRALQTCVGAGESNDGECAPMPMPALGLTGVAVVSAGGGVTCARTDRGATECWGENQMGQLGDGGNGGPASCTTATGTVPCATTPHRVRGVA